MIAYRLLKPQSQPDFQEVPAPHAGPGQVVLKVAGCGLCHTDISVAGRDPAFWEYVERFLVDVGIFSKPPRLVGRIRTKSCRPRDVE